MNLTDGTLFVLENRRKVKFVKYQQHIYHLKRITMKVNIQANYSMHSILAYYKNISSLYTHNMKVCSSLKILQCATNCIISKSTKLDEHHLHAF